MRPEEVSLVKKIEKKLIKFSKEVNALPGIESSFSQSCFTAQIIDSIRRIKYVTVIRDKDLSDIYADPTNVFFDPLKAASWHRKNGRTDEAFWLVFLSVHFGKNLKTKWNLVRDTYGARGEGFCWDWETASADFISFRRWLSANQAELKNNGKFGNHRKYQSIDAFSATGTGSTIGSYIDWVGESHEALIASIIEDVGDNPRIMFDSMYESMNAVVGFGRTARFDYLTMIGKLGLAEIEPASTYMHGATGPKLGACLLFKGRRNFNISESDLNNLLVQLEAYLGLYFGMQVLEDALCNWQKSPNQYVYFGG